MFSTAQYGRFSIRHALTTLAISLASSASFGAASLADDTLFYAPDVYSKAGNLIQIPSGPQPGGDAAVLKLLIVHTPRFVQALQPQDPDLVAYMQRSVAAVNQFFANTGLATRVELSGIIEWNRPAGSSLQDDLDALPDFVERQTQLRDQTGADFVQLWELPEAGVDTADICGWGQIVGPNLLVSTSGYGYSGVMRGLPGTAHAGCYANSSPEEFALLVAHELGHNLGSAHDWNESGSEGAFEFSHGSYCGNLLQGILPGTIMSRSLLRVPHFSSPSLFQNGSACGTAVTAPYPSNNRETFTRTASHMAKLRTDPTGLGIVFIDAPSSIAEYSAWLPVTLNRTNTIQPASVELLTYSVGSTRDVDFSMPYRVQVNFAPGQSSVIVPVTLIANERREATEQLRFWIQAGVNVVIGSDRSKLVSIRDNAWPTSSETLPALDTLDAQGSLGSYVEPSDSGVSSGDGGSGAVSIFLLLLSLLAGGRRRIGRRIQCCHLTVI